MEVRHDYWKWVIAFDIISIYRLKNRSKVRAKFSGCKPRTYLTGRSKSLEEDTYTACPVGVVKEEGEGIELREEDEIQDKDKDYYFVDTSLIGNNDVCDLVNV